MGMLRVMRLGSYFRNRGSRMLLVLLMGVLLSDVGDCRWILIVFMGVLSEVVGWVSGLHLSFV